MTSQAHIQILESYSTPTQRAVFAPLAGIDGRPSSQQLAIDTKAHHTLYHGTRGPGKTAAQVMLFRRYVGLGYGKFWKGVIFDCQHKDFDDLVSQTERLFPQFEDGCRFSQSPSRYKWTWPTGEELLFRHVDQPKDYKRFHGHEYPFIGWNELTKFPDEELYDLMMSVNRCSFSPEVNTPRDRDGNYLTPDGKPLPPIPMFIFSTTNPDGAGHHWVKERFIDKAPAGRIHIDKSEVFDPQTQKKQVVERSQVHIWGSHIENHKLTKEYIAELLEQCRGNKRRFMAWFLGRWDIPAGGALDDVWTDANLVERFKVPDNWYVDRSMDWGSSTPYSIGWWATANGEEVELPSGNKFCPAADSLIQVYEDYGAVSLSKNKGVRRSATEVAYRVTEIEQQLQAGGWIGLKPYGGPADTQIKEVREADTETIQEKMSRLGVYWTDSDKAKGARVNGLALIRDRLEAVTKYPDQPGLYFMRNCVASTKLLPAMPPHPVQSDDVDTKAIDHVYDMVRYRVLKSGRASSAKLKVVFPY